MFVQLDVAVDKEAGLQQGKTNKTSVSILSTFPGCGFLWDVKSFLLVHTFPISEIRNHATWIVLNHFPDLTRSKCQAVIFLFADLDYLGFLFLKIFYFSLA